MQAGQVLGWVLGLCWVATLQGLPVLQKPLYTTQENFDLNNFLGEWYDVAMATSCPHAHRSEAKAAIGTLEVKVPKAGKIETKMTALWGGVCKEMTINFELTTTPGRFYYHIASCQTEVDAYVVHSNYREYAIIIISERESSANTSTSVKLFSRTRQVRDTVLADFKTLVRDLGMSEDNVIIKQDKGTCVPGEEMTAEATAEQGFLSVPRMRRDVVASSAAPEEEGSGFDGPSVIYPDACQSEPDSGPCFGMQLRYFYNSSSMSCHEFQYGGCMGNHNNFVAERECLQRCRSEAACRLPMVAQPCVGQPPVWSFDALSGQCLAYKPGYCQGNGNKFYSKAECEEYCGVVQDDAEILKTN